MSVHDSKRSALYVALFAALVTPCSFALAQSSDSDEARTLDRVTVTGSLIPRTEIETATPVTVISAESIQARGFQSVSDVLQQSTFATGGFQGGQTSASFTQGAEAAGMFGLDPGYTKYLINGRPMSNYPALYNGSDVFNNISGIPVSLVERIEILPGGQSSLYGSDAIAGVVNVILKKDLDAAEMSVRGGWFTEGGGSSFRFTFADTFSGADGRFNSLFGIQLDQRNPIWGYQRDLTRQYNVDGYTDAFASRDFVVLDALNNTYLFTDPNNCANTTGQFGGSTSLWDRPGFGQYCGSFISPGYRTLRNGKEGGQLYSYSTFDFTPTTQGYVEIMGNYEEVEYATGSSYTWWGTGVKWGAYYDPNLERLVNLQRSFAPEDIGGAGYQDIMNTDRNKAYTLTIGLNGQIGDWDYDVYASRNEYRLTERNWVRWADPINDYFERTVLGPQLGVDPIYDFYPIFSPDYAAFYSPMSPTDFASFTGFLNTESRTWANLARAQATNTALFSLPGGEAGLALAVEAGNEGWDYSPDERMLADPDTLESAVWGQTSVNGAGRRSRYALTSELRLPLFDPLTVTLSGRYDAFDVAGNTVDSPTYSIGLEYRPVESLLLRGKYGTAFRAPSLADTFQGLSGFYSRNTDFYRCSLEGYDPVDTDGCTWDSTQFFGQQSGNTELEAIEADVWSAGVVFAPSANLSIAVDYYNWDITNEVDQLSARQLLLTEYVCRTGQPGSVTTSCENALEWVQRSANGELVSVYTPKVNIAQQKLEAMTVSANYLLDIGAAGSLAFAANYTNRLSHEITPSPGDEAIDLLRDPYYMWIYDTYAKTRTDASVAWSLGDWTTTVYANRQGSTPNYLAYNSMSWDYEHPSGERAGRWGSYTTYNISATWRALDNLTFSAMVNNAFNKMPDNQARNHPGTTTTPYNNYFYDVFGRAVYLEAKYQFN
ncbi:TonB-dependent receptor plug domain-containing protein [Luteimonas abyssi]|uniref:TonB-dependent receptor plug domain-containing protein n=1 Tax=Luteimonas abyssi TaxID=1247514 RepID=UPI000737C967|nr:TonB-dependent receptor [Luteimonas abyssi]